MHLDNPYFDRELDASGLVFPLPIWKIEKMLAEMAVGQVLKLIASGCSIAIHVQQFAEQTGNKLLSKREIRGLCIFYLRKDAANYRQTKSYFDRTLHQF